MLNAKYQGRDNVGITLIVNKRKWLGTLRSMFLIIHNNNNGGFIFTVIGLYTIIVHWNSIIDSLEYFPLFFLRLVDSLCMLIIAPDFLYLSVIAFLTIYFTIYLTISFFEGFPKVYSKLYLK